MTKNQSIRATRGGVAKKPFCSPALHSMGVPVHEKDFHATELYHLLRWRIVMQREAVTVSAYGNYNKSWKDLFQHGKIPKTVAAKEKVRGGWMVLHQAKQIIRIPMRIGAYQNFHFFTKQERHRPFFHILEEEKNEGRTKP